MKKTLTAILLLSSILLVRCKEEKPFSVQVVSSEMTRNADCAHLDGMGGKLKWNYTTGLELRGRMV